MHAVSSPVKSHRAIVSSDAYHEFTLELEKAEVMLAHIATRLDALSMGEHGSELYALGLIARQTCDEQFERISDKCRAMLGGLD